MEEDLLLQMERQRSGDLIDIESAVHVEHERVVRAEFPREVTRQPVEVDKLVDLVELLLVARTRGIDLLDELRDIAEDGGIYARARELRKIASPNSGT